MSATTTPTILSPEEKPLLSRDGWIVLGLLAISFIGLFWIFIWRMKDISLASLGQEGDWSYVPLIPIMCIYFVYLRRERLAVTNFYLYWPGLVIMLAGIGCYVLGIHPVKNIMVQGYGMVMTLAGLVLFLGGWGGFKILWFPVLYLAFAVKISDRIWEKLAFELQQIAAAGSTIMLKAILPLLGSYVEADGAHISVMTSDSTMYSMTVAEACSGLKMLMTFLALGVAVAFITPRTWWQRLILVISTVPVALFSNMIRVTLLGVVAAKFDPAYAQGDFHLFLGMLTLIPALGLYLLIGWALDKIIIEDPEANLKKEKQLIAEKKAFKRESFGTLNASSIARGAGIGAFIMVPAVLAFIGVFLLLTTGAGALAQMSRIYAALLILGGGSVILAALFVITHLLQKRFSGFRVPVNPQAIGLVLAMIVLSWGGIAVAQKSLEAVLFKKELPLQILITELPKVVYQEDELGMHEQWIFLNNDGTGKLGKDEKLEPDIEKTLGTTHYIMRDYLPYDFGERGKPKQQIRLHVAYYTGTPDTVPHVPERCFVAGGAQQEQIGVIELQLDPSRFTPEINQETGEPQYYWADAPYEKFDPKDITKYEKVSEKVRIPSLKIPATYFVYRIDAEGSDPIENTVIYFFAANGKFLATPDQVRLNGFSLQDEYAYYAKIEILIPHAGRVLPGDDVDEISASARAELAKRYGKERAELFLADMLPQIMRALPDWEEVKKGNYPPKQ